ncbi:hypothetical protein C6N75_02990 [Streptomyces solincola]|uniref:Uncharacterized protein n=1 Tax=Streptomyces solincola TaxID=2100817 RepID=A0A2S9Q1V8_9ACTN|nr:hypothetical protein [Streptomyces solincola]PRH80654.1 hypothetical protein C6N75_02990 [Streptomyces solincola]
MKRAVALLATTLIAGAAISPSVAFAASQPSGGNPAGYSKSTHSHVPLSGDVLTSGIGVANEKQTADLTITAPAGKFFNGSWQAYSTGMSDSFANESVTGAGTEGDPQVLHLSFMDNNMGTNHMYVKAGVDDGPAHMASASVSSAGEARADLVIQGTRQAPHYTGEWQINQGDVFTGSGAEGHFVHVEGAGTPDDPDIVHIEVASGDGKSPVNGLAFFDGPQAGGGAGYTAVSYYQGASISKGSGYVDAQVTCPASYPVMQSSSIAEDNSTDEFVRWGPHAGGSGTASDPSYARYSISNWNVLDGYWGGYLTAKCTKS